MSTSTVTHSETNTAWDSIGSAFARLALAAGFLSAVADRLGLWGPPGATNVSWGNFGNFTSYVAQLNFFAPSPLMPLLAWAATLAEAGLATALLVGWRTRLVAFASGLLLLSFASTMTLALGLKSPLDYSVFAACAAAFLLSGRPPDRWTLDSRIVAEETPVSSPEN